MGDGSQFLRFHRLHYGRWRSPAKLRGANVAAFLTHMAVERRLAESTQNQALYVLVFLYETVLAVVVCRPSGTGVLRHHEIPRLAPWATFCRRYAAGDSARERAG